MVFSHIMLGRVTTATVVAAAAAMTTAPPGERLSMHSHRLNRLTERIGVFIARPHCLHRCNRHDISVCLSVSPSVCHVQKLTFGDLVLTTKHARNSCMSLLSVGFHYCNALGWSCPQNDRQQHSKGHLLRRAAVGHKAVEGPTVAHCCVSKTISKPTCCQRALILKPGKI